MHSYILPKMIMMNIPKRSIMACPPNIRGRFLQSAYIQLSSTKNYSDQGTNKQSMKGRLLQSASVQLNPTRNYTNSVKPPLTDKTNSAYCMGSVVKVHAARWPHSLNIPYLWLRDHCRSPKCYNYNTFQRIQDLHDIPLNIQPSKVEATPNGLCIEWPDGHLSNYEYKFLWQNIFEGRKTSYKRLQKPWTSATFPKDRETHVPFSELQKSEDAQRKFLTSIVKNGLGFITHVPENVESTRAAVETICPVMWTFFGEMWSFEADLAKADTAYSNEYLGAHTDQTYFSQAARIQVFHCLQAAPEGGETLLVDGFAVAEQYKTLHPKGYTYLSKTPIPSEYIGDDQHHYSLDTIFRENSVTGQIQQFRYNLYDRAPFSSLPLDQVNETYIHIRNLSNIIRKKKNEYWIKLEPGTVLLIDNWRVMHGRASYSGPRVMGGCYLSNDSLTSKARVLGVQLD